MKHYGKLTAAAAAGFMTLSAMGVAPVFAADGDNKTEIAIVKTLNLNDTTLNAPKAKFTFSATPATVTDNETKTFNNVSYNVYSGITNGLTAEGSSLTAETAGTPENGVVNYTGAKLVAASTGYTAPGLYKYTVTEDNIDTTVGGNDDITKDDIVYTVYVAVQYETVDDKEVLKPVSILAYKGDAAAKSDHLQFDNELAESVSANILTVTKHITGSQGVKSKPFTFTVTAEGAEGDKFKYSTDGGETWSDMTVGEDKKTNTATANLSDGQTVKIKGLSSTDTYSVTENKEDYTLDSLTGADTNDKDNVRASGNLSTGPDNVVFTNKKDGAVPTGILMSAAPYVGLVGLGGIFAGLFFRRKRED